MAFVSLPISSVVLWFASFVLAFTLPAYVSPNGPKNWAMAIINGIALVAFFGSIVAAVGHRLIDWRRERKAKAGTLQSDSQADGGNYGC